MAALPQRSRAASSSKSIVLFVGSVIVLLRSLLRLLAAELFGLLVPLLALLVVAVEQLPAADAADVDEAVRAGEGRARLMTFSRHAHASAGAADLAVVLQLCRELDGVQSGLLRVGLDRRLVPLVVQLLGSGPWASRRFGGCCRSSRLVPRRLLVLEDDLRRLAPRGADGDVVTWKSRCDMGFFPSSAQTALYSRSARLRRLTITQKCFCVPVL
mmetsp:Transcript_42561/g.117809  ORF Transcript_42561/g.117809 Transcript_42561/m.117809 type:complete len:214 (+) Transcript_42561:200-841(+)